MKIFSTLVAGAFAATAFGTIACAAPIIDQSNLVTISSSVTPSASGIRSSSIRQAQSVTAGVAGTLANIDLQLFSRTGSGSLDISILRGKVTDAAPTVLATVSIADTDIPTLSTIGVLQYFSVDLSSLGLDFDVGDIFSILLDARPALLGDTKRFGWINGPDASDTSLTAGLAYAGGEANIENIGYGWEPALFDRGFRTWVNARAADIPEPATGFIAMFGFVGLAARRKAFLRVTAA
jgi:PEP-CTERM motif